MDDIKGMEITIGGSSVPGAGDQVRSGGGGFAQYPNNINVDKRAVSSKTAQAGLNGQKQEQEQSPQASGGTEDTLELSPEAKRMLESLKARDRLVRAHEAAHLAAASGIAKGGAQFSMQRGPDGNMYAVGGEVSIDASEVPNDPQATIAKARQIVAAALAPADPSPQDRAVAASARQMETKAAAELANGTDSDNSADSSDSPVGANSSNDQSAQELSAQGRRAVNAYNGGTSPQETSNIVARAYQTVA